MLVLSLTSVTALEAQWLDVKTPGIPRTADGNPDLTAPAPRTADGKPELTGLWRSAGTTGDLRDPTKIQAWVQTAMAEHERDYYKNGPHMLCLPGGPALIIEPLNEVDAKEFTRKEGEKRGRKQRKSEKSIEE
jgi:hypothetical protein